MSPEAPRVPDRNPVPAVPAGIHCAADYEAFARRKLDAPVYEYIAGGSGEDRTVAANRAAFDTLAILPRLLRELRSGHTRIRLLDRELAHPILLAPLAFQQLVHPRGEAEAAAAAAATDTCIVCSTLASCRLEDLAALAGPQRWFQLYFQPDRETTLGLVERAQAAGYGAIVVTLDTPVQTPSLRSLRAGFRLPPTLQPPNLAGVAAPPQSPLAPGASRIFQGMMSEAPTRDDFAWLLRQTKLPVLAKGVLRPDDATMLRDLGAAGIVVSNHGGRALDGVPASLEMLGPVRRALGPGFPLLVDGGIRSGSDVFKALALGADAVLVGRLQAYAACVAGALGVAHMIRLLREELELCMALSGCATVPEIDAGMLVATTVET
ncbi:MAG: alpha-hydroxy-acid oxidizing protein [Limnobacter sp.]|nr:alpha-hydroxy-acid oxidizing protein [Limnobacter sp.]